MIDSLSGVTFSQFLPDQPSHHALDPLLPDNGILRSLQPWRIRIVYSFKGWGDFGFSCEEELGFWGWHAAAAASISADEVLWCLECLD